MIKTADPSKHKYSANSIRYGACGNFLLSDGNRFGKNVILGADISSSVDTDNNNINIFILNKSGTGALDYDTLTAEKE